MRSVRQCSRSACTSAAVATLTYVYADSTAVLGPLAHLAEPHSYDLCADHADSLTAPRGWEVVRLVPDVLEERGPSPDDLSALADAVREAGRGGQKSQPQPLTTVERPSHTAPDSAPGVTETARRGHLRVLRAEE